MGYVYRRRRPELYDKVLVPEISRGERKCDARLDLEDPKEIPDYLTKSQFASGNHVLLALLWEMGGIRTGSVDSIDLQDGHLQDEYIDLVHRLDTGTTLKNGKTGEPPIAITSGFAELLGEYIDNRRIDVDDEYGREPLLTNENGRYSRTVIRMSVYRMTAPCFRDESCPNCNRGLEKKCPEAVSPHAIRRGRITHFLTSDVPEDVVSHRMNLSRKDLHQHYDNRPAEVKLEQLRGYLDNI